MLNSDGYENGSTLLVHFFDVVLHDYNVKRPSYSSYVGNVVYAHQKFFLLVFLFAFFYSLLLIFNLLTANISHFLTANFRFFTSNEIRLLCFLSNALALSLFLLTTSVKI